MGGRRRKTLERHLSEAELDDAIDEAEDGEIVRRLVFVKNLYRGDTVEEAAERVGRSESTGDRWTERWNDGGLDGLPPAFGGGRPPKLDAEERAALRERLREGQPWKPRDVRELLETEFGVEYHPSYLSDFLRSLGLSYSPPQTNRRSRSGGTDDTSATNAGGSHDGTENETEGGWKLDDDGRTDGGVESAARSWPRSKTVARDE